MGRLAFSFIIWVGIAATAVAQETEIEPYWIKDSNSGCAVWNSNPKPIETITWSGSCRNGKADGRGVLQWYRDGKPGDRYEGDTKIGKAHGLGVFTDADGSRYEGEHVDGKAHGRGVFTDSDGSRYEGEFVNGSQRGRGILTWPSSDRYEGEFVDNAFQGRGVYIWANGDRYEGDFVEGDFHGRGVHLQSNGERYEGAFVKGKKHGIGDCRDGKTERTGRCEYSYGEFIRWLD